MKKLLTYTLAVLLLSTAFTATSQDEGFIFGTVTTIDGDTYQGAIRWGKEEVYWTDIFNASKEKNDNIKYLTSEQLDDIRDSRSSWWGINSSVWWGDWDKQAFIHQFACQFGEIKSFEMSSRDGAYVTMQNGNTHKVDGSGYNDIGTDIKVYDGDLGVVKLDWSRIEKIVFDKTPAKLDNKFGEPLFGTVETSEGSFSGFVQWDHDERVSKDLLDGDTENGDVSIEFGQITSIERFGSSRSIVKLKSGRELTLSGSNDVNDGNRGIIVTVEGLGRVDIPWDEFEKVTFESIKGSGPDYKSFSNQNSMRAKVISKDDELIEGLLAFDLDERYDYEILHGMLGDIEMLVPFRNIKELAPRNYDNTTVTLKTGVKYTLGKSQDVSDKNTGLLMKNGDQYTYITYDRVKSLSFN